MRISPKKFLNCLLCLRFLVLDEKITKMENWLYWVDLAGVAVFAVSGTLMAFKKHMDGFGVIVLASVTAIGGGTLRDMILNVPVYWLTDPNFFYVILVAAISTIFMLRWTHWFPLRYLLLADAIGLAFFNMMGLQKALSMGTTPFVAIILGAMTGVFGGLIRDVICREIPLVLKGELYAMTCIAGGLCYIGIDYFTQNTQLAMFSCVAVTLIFRLCSIHWHWHFPVFKGFDHPIIRD